MYKQLVPLAASNNKRKCNILNAVYRMLMLAILKIIRMWMIIHVHKSDRMQMHDIRANESIFNT